MTTRPLKITAASMRKAKREHGIDFTPEDVARATGGIDLEFYAKVFLIGRLADFPDFTLAEARAEVDDLEMAEMIDMARNAFARFNASNPQAQRQLRRRGFSNRRRLSRPWPILRRPIL